MKVNELFLKCEINGLKKGWMIFVFAQMDCRNESCAGNGWSYKCLPGDGMGGMKCMSIWKMLVYWGQFIRYGMVRNCSFLHQFFYGVEECSIIDSISSRNFGQGLRMSETLIYVRLWYFNQVSIRYWRIKAMVWIFWSRMRVNEQTIKFFEVVSKERSSKWFPGRNR